MKTMKTLFVALALSLAVGKLHAVRVVDAIDAETVRVASATIFTGQGYLYGIGVGTGTAFNYVVAYDTVALTNVTAYTSFIADQQKTPAIFFSSTTAGGVIEGNKYNTVWTPPAPIRINNGLYIYKPVAGSGDANNAVIYFSR